MNERIRELALKAKLGGAEFDNGIRYYVGTAESFEKFAELIVQECAESLWTEECYTSDLALKEFEKNSKKIKLHFGVEE